jgi:hypothetical protein
LTASGAFNTLARVRLTAIEFTQEIIDLLQRFDGSQFGSNFTTDRVALEIPGNVLSNISARMVLVAIEKLDQQLGVALERVRHGTKPRLNLHFFTPKCCL